MGKRARHYAGYDAGARKAPRRRSSGGRWPSARAFFEALRRRTPANAAATDRRIHSKAGAEVAILTCDASGFSRRTHEHGILHFLAGMTQCYDEMIPIIERCGGDCLSHNADNLLAVFERDTDAVRAAIAMQRWLKRRNRRLRDADRFHACIGVHRGPVIRLKDNVFGDAVNVAAKLGEDLAAKDEILLSRAVADRARGAFRLRYSRSTELGGRNFELFRVLY